MTVSGTTRRVLPLELLQRHNGSSSRSAAMTRSSCAFGGHLVSYYSSTPSSWRVVHSSASSTTSRSTTRRLKAHCSLSSLTRQLSTLSLSSATAPALTAKQVSAGCVQELREQLAKIEGIFAQIEGQIGENEKELAFIYRRYYATYAGIFMSASRKAPHALYTPGAIALLNSNPDGNRLGSIPFRAKVIQLCKKTEGSLNETIEALNLLFKELHTFHVISLFSVPPVQIWSIDNLPAIFSKLTKLIQNSAQVLTPQDMNSIYAEHVLLAKRAESCKRAIERQREALDEAEQIATDVTHRLFSSIEEAWLLPRFRKQASPPQFSAKPLTPRTAASIAALATADS